jgi:uncharacterized protein with PIN domain
VILRALSTSGNRVNAALLNACASKCVKAALEKAGTRLIEPVMALELTLIYDETRGEAHSRALLSELAHRRAVIDEMSQDGAVKIESAALNFFLT